MNKKKISNVASTAFLLLGGVFALQVLISNVSAATNRVNMADEKEGDYISGIMDQNNTKDEVDALFVGDVCIFSESGYFDNVVGKNGYADKDAKKVRINCDGTVPGVTFDKSTRTLALDGYTGNEKIIYFDTKKSAKDDFNIKVYGENKVGGIRFYEHIKGDKLANVNVSGGGILNLSTNTSWYSWGDSDKEQLAVNISNVDIRADRGIGASVLNFDNVKFKGSFSGKEISIKNSSVEYYGYNESANGIGDYTNSNISIENTEFLNSIEYLLSSTLEIKNSTVEIKNTKEYAGDSSYSYRYYETPIPVMAYEYLGKATSADLNGMGAIIEEKARITLDSVVVKDNLKIKTSVGIYKGFCYDNQECEATEKYEESIFATDDTVFNYETHRWENYPKNVVITAKKPELVGAKITKEEKNKDNNGDNGEKKNIRPVEKDILEGAGQEMNMNEIKDLVIRYNRDFKLFEKVTMNGKEVPAESYEVKSGSTVLTIKAAYLKNLGAGEHKVAAYFKGEEKPIETTVTLKVKSAGNQGSFTTDEMISSECGLGALFAILSAVMISVGISLKVKGKKTISKRYF